MCSNFENKPIKEYIIDIIKNIIMMIMIIIDIITIIIINNA